MQGNLENSAVATRKGQFSFQSERKAMPKDDQTTAQLHSSHTPVKECSKFSKPGFNTIWTENFQIFITTPWTAAHQSPPSMGFSRQEYWSGVPLPSPYVAPIWWEWEGPWRLAAMIRLLCFFLSPLYPNHGTQPGPTQSWCLMNMCGSEGQARISDQLNSFSFMIIACHLHCASISKRHEMKSGISWRLWF